MPERQVLRIEQWGEESYELELRPSLERFLPWADLQEIEAVGAADDPGRFRVAEDSEA